MHPRERSGGCVLSIRWDAVGLAFGCDIVRRWGMALTPEDIEALRMLRREELTTRDEFEEFQQRVEARFDQVDQSLDALFKVNETREQENLVIKHQLAELEKKVA